MWLMEDVYSLMRVTDEFLENLTTKKSNDSSYSELSKKKGKNLKSARHASCDSTQILSPRVKFKQFWIYSWNPEVLYEKK